MGALLVGPTTGNVVSPVDPRARKRVCLLVVPTVNSLPRDMPPDVGHLLKAAIDRAAKVCRSEARLRSRVANDGNTIAENAGSENGAVCFPVLPSQ